MTEKVSTVDTHVTRVLVVVNDLLVVSTLLGGGAKWCRHGSGSSGNSGSCDSRKAGSPGGGRNSRAGNGYERVAEHVEV